MNANLETASKHKIVYDFLKQAITKYDPMHKGGLVYQNEKDWLRLDKKDGVAIRTMGPADSRIKARLMNPKASHCVESSILKNPIEIDSNETQKITLKERIRPPLGSKPAKRPE